MASSTYSDASDFHWKASSTDSNLSVNTNWLYIHASGSAEATVRGVELELTAGVWKFKVSVAALLDVKLGCTYAYAARPLTFRYALGLGLSASNYINKAKVLCQKIGGDCLSADSVYDSVTQEVALADTFIASRNSEATTSGESQEMTNSERRAATRQTEVIEKATYIASLLSLTAGQHQRITERSELAAEVLSETTQTRQDSVASDRLEAEDIVETDSTQICTTTMTTI